MSAMPPQQITQTMYAPISQDNPRFGVIIVTGSGTNFMLTEIESMEVEKSDSGDAGTWSFTCPLGIAANNTACSVIMPMDIVALYGCRAFVDSAGSTSPPIDVFSGSSSGTISIAGLSYGAIATTTTLQTPTCLMIGMVDAVEETYDYEEARLTLTVNGRDLTKIFIDNDTIVPSTLITGAVFSTMSSFVIAMNKQTSGTILLESVLDIFVAKSVVGIQALTAPGAPTMNAAQAAAVGAYGYPWRNFVDASKLMPGFQHLADGDLMEFAVQSGSAWANVSDLRNYPITRLFVDELGRLIFDDTWTAWGFGSSSYVMQGPILVLNDYDVRRADFRQADDALITSLSITNSTMLAADRALASLVSFGKQVSGAPTLLSRYGYRYLQFVSQYDPITAVQAAELAGTAVAAPGFDTATTDISKSALAARYPIIWQMCNDLWEATFIVKGNAKWRAGQRLSTDICGTNPLTQPMTTGGQKFWYITDIHHSMTYGSDWTTTIKCRFARDA